MAKLFGYFKKEDISNIDRLKDQNGYSFVYRDQLPVKIICSVTNWVIRVTVEISGILWVRHPVTDRNKKDWETIHTHYIYQKGVDNQKKHVEISKVLQDQEPE